MRACVRVDVCVCVFFECSWSNVLCGPAGISTGHFHASLVLATIEEGWGEEGHPSQREGEGVNASSQPRSVPTAIPRCVASGVCVSALCVCVRWRESGTPRSWVRVCVCVVCVCMCVRAGGCLCV
ncbi:MAG: hypothetical protein P4L40_03300 [Terracidiphilus sp.]|nr:hypothetical protein [Terracidiphilus sp.]